MQQILGLMSIYNVRLTLKHFTTFLFQKRFKKGSKTQLISVLKLIKIY